MRFLIRMKVLIANPCNAIERPKVQPGIARGLSAEQIRRLLEVLPETPVGLRDRAILTLVFTGRRRSEVLGMTASSLSFEDAVFTRTEARAERQEGVNCHRRRLRQLG